MKQQKKDLYVRPEVGRLPVDARTSSPPGLMTVIGASGQGLSTIASSLENAIKDDLCLDLLLHRIYTVTLVDIPLSFTHSFHQPYPVILQ